ncbi:MAG TPA: amidase, partial [Dehalococcoidia bacterium]|nr:amidase [Dehalococcoidia bacterium]
MSDLWFVPAYDLARQVRSGALSPVELMEACLARIDETNPVLNAFIATRPEQALTDARAMAERIA